MRLVVIILLGCLAWGDGIAQKKHSYTIIAYYSGDAKGIDRFPVEKLTHIIFSFCYLKGSRLWVPSRSDSITIRKLVSLKKDHPNLKVLLSLGGWGGCKTCSKVFSSDEGRKNFARSVHDLTNYFNTDGIDIDWEFPAVESYPGHPYSPADKENFTALLKALRAELGPGREISFIAAAFSPYLQQSTDWKNVMPVADRVNLMSYDIIGSKSKITGHHTNLYSSPQQKESTDNAVKYLDSLNVPLNKIAIGAAFYARLFERVDTPSNGLYQPGKFKRFVSWNEMRTSFTSRQGYVEYWDSVAKAPYRYNSKKKIYLTYDDERSIKLKAEYLIKNNLNGIMFWELRLDNSNRLLNSIYQSLQTR